MSLGAGSGATIFDVVNWVRMADDRGFDSAWLIDSQLLYADVYSSLAACALNTNKIKLGTGVTVLQTRHATVTANSIASINELSHGRAELGLGPGDSSIRMLGITPASQQLFKESIVSIRKLLRGEEVRFGKNSVKLQRPSQVPIYAAATGPNMLKLAAQVADGAIVITGVTPGLVQYAFNYLKVGAEQAGRSLQQIDVVWFIHFSVSKNREEARKDVRAGTASAANKIARVFELNPAATPKDLRAHMKQIRSIKDSYDYRHHVAVGAPHGSLVTDELIDLFEIAGTPDDCIKKIGIMRDAGVNNVCFLLYGVPHSRKGEVIDIFSKEVMPSFN